MRFASSNWAAGHWVQNISAFIYSARTRLKIYGSYGRMLENSLTVYDYLRRGTLHYNSLTTGQRAWLSTEGGDIRLNVETFPEYRSGCVSDTSLDPANYPDKFKKSGF